MRKIISVLAAAVVAVGIAGAADSSAAPASAPAAAPSSGYTPPAIAWGKCASASLQSAGAQCGMLVVPMDYAHPTGTKIEIAVSRILHTTTKYQGVMITNPGGPGGSGLTLSVLKYYVPGTAADSYDWIGFDPRGVGSSVPSLSCNPNFFHGNRAPYRPTTKSIYDVWVNRSKAYAQDCAKSPNAALFNHVKTIDTINDMESLRKALGQQQINYYGFSYGTELGQQYMTLHPDRVRRFVLDSNVDPRRSVYQSNQDQDVAFQKTFDIYFTWLAKYSSVYHVGNTYAEVRNRFLTTESQLDQPGQAAGGVLGGDELLDVFTSAGYYVYGWEDIAAAYSKYLHTGNADDLIQMYTDANPTDAGGDNGYALYLGTQCTDQPWPRDQAKLNSDNWRLDNTYNYFTWSNAWFNGPCAYWPFQAGTPVTVKNTGVHVPILLIDETNDAATPYPGSLYVRKLFPTASLIEGKDGSTHAGSLSGVACTDNRIAAYLANGTVPARVSGNRSDKVCPPVPQPDPTATGAARVSTTRLADLHSILQRAQRP